MSHTPPRRYANAFTGQLMQPRIEHGQAVLFVVLGRAIGCIVAVAD
ncbi:MAG: hypothetical protein ACHRHE_19755 [Tepidisphaerales bacterium]